MKRYSSFEEIDNQFKLKMPESIYKYRAWGIDTHEKIIKDCELWFAHPHTLNDPFDVRPPYNFICENINIETAKKRLRDAGRQLQPQLNMKELEDEIELRLELILKDPIGYFKEANRGFILEKSNYDNIGILSFCLTECNESMWAYYGNNHAGFAIGFKTVELARTINSTVGFVDYCDTPINYEILGDNHGIMEAEIFRKSTRWIAEEELRFVTLGIDKYRKRTIRFLPDVVHDIVLGINALPETEEMIINEAGKTMPTVPIFKLKTKTDSFGFDKIRVK